MAEQNDKPKDIAEKLSRKDTKKLLSDILHLFDFQVLRKKQSKQTDEQGYGSLRELIDFIRVSVKYKLFEAEALQREVMYFIKKLKDNNIDTP